MSLLKLKTVTAEDFERHDEDCYFCNKNEPPPEAREDNYTDNFDEDKLIGAVSAKGIKHENDSGKLGTNCAPSPNELWVTTDDWPIQLPVEFAAHHLIPGNGSLKPSTLFRRLGVEGSSEKNVGYDVNNKANGEWLPGNYAFSNRGCWGNKGKTLTEDFTVLPQDYAFTAIEACGKQFHDSHKAYNDEVRKKLNEIAGKLKEIEKHWCPKATKVKDRHLPMFPLVNRLAALSARLRKMLAGPKKDWRINIYTSAFSLQWMEARSARKKAK